MADIKGHIDENGDVRFNVNDFVNSLVENPKFKKFFDKYDLSNEMEEVLENLIDLFEKQNISEKLLIDLATKKTVKHLIYTCYGVIGLLITLIILNLI